MPVYEANENTFLRALPANGAAMVVFKTSWCGPCKALVPVLEAISVMNPELTMLRVDSEGSPMIAQKFNVRSVPAPFWVTIQNGVITGADRLPLGPQALRLEVARRLGK